MDKTEYKQKLDSILADGQKFRKINRNQTNELKIEVNKLIKMANQNNKQPLIKPITGEYNPGYLYGTVKIHKFNNPLRPIISEVTRPAHNTAKEFNNIITLYLPAKYQINSSNDFPRLLYPTHYTPHWHPSFIRCWILFTNAPVLKTIDIICDCVDKHPVIPPPPIPKDIMKKIARRLHNHVPIYPH